MVKGKRFPGVFVDRDGTLIRDVGYLNRLGQLELLPGVSEAIKMLKRQELKVAVVTNQSAVARGLLQENDLIKIHLEMKRRLATEGAILDGIYYCPHHPTEGQGPYRRICECRKPKPGLIEKASRELGLDPSRSYVVGDQIIDMQLAVTVGSKGVLIKNGGGESEGRGAPVAGQDTAIALYTARDFADAAQWILRDYEKENIHGAHR